MPSTTLASGLILLVLCSGSALAQAGLEACMNGIQACTQTMTSSMGPGMTQDQACGQMSSFIECVMALDCPMSPEQKQGIIAQSTQSLTDQGINCDFGGAGGAGAGTGTGGAGVDMSGFSSACTEGMSTCTDTFTNGIKNVGGTDNPVKEMCRIVDVFTSCITNLPCPLSAAQKEQLVSQSTAGLKEQGIDCAAGTATGGGMGGGMGGMVIPEQCSSGIQGCSKDLSEFFEGISGMPDLKVVCEKINDFKECIKGIPCEMSDEMRNSVISRSTDEWKKNGMDCTSGSTSTIMDAMKKMHEVESLMNKHGCPNVTSTCSNEYNVGIGGNNANKCSNVLSSGKCMFEKCEAIKGTGDGDKAADLLVTVANVQFSCKITANQVKDTNGQTSIHQSFMFASLMVLTTILTKAFFY